MMVIRGALPGSLVTENIRTALLVRLDMRLRHEVLVGRMTTAVRREVVVVRPEITARRAVATGRFITESRRDTLEGSTAPRYYSKKPPLRR
jgi:hypothetical protein